MGLGCSQTTNAGAVVVRASAAVTLAPLLAAWQDGLSNA